MVNLDDLQISLGFLFEKFGGTDKIGLALLINGGLAAIGLVIFLVFDGWISYAGLVWAIINLSGIVKWVFRL